MNAYMVSKDEARAMSDEELVNEFHSVCAQSGEMNMGSAPAVLKQELRRRLQSKKKSD